MPVSGMSGADPSGSADEAKNVVPVQQAVEDASLKTSVPQQKSKDEMRKEKVLAALRNFSTTPRAPTPPPPPAVAQPIVLPHEVPSRAVAPVVPKKENLVSVSSPKKQEPTLSKKKGWLLFSRKPAITDAEKKAARIAMLVEKARQKRSPQKKSWSLFTPHVKVAASVAVQAPQKKEAELLTLDALREGPTSHSVETKKVEPPKDHAVTTPPIKAETRSSSLESVQAALNAFRTAPPKPKGKIISAAEIKKEAENAKAALDAKREAPIEPPKQKVSWLSTLKFKKSGTAELPADSAKKGKPVLHKQSSGMEKFMASLNHFGLGKERMAFTENLATMLDAGLPLIDSLQTLMAEGRSKPMKKVIKEIYTKVENGSPLWRAMDSEDLFSLHAIALIRIGEEAGSLAENMKYLAAQETKDRELVQKVKMAMIYPSIVMGIMFVIVMGLGLFVLPNLIGVLTSLNVPLPFITRMIIAFTNAFTTYGLIIVPSSIVGIIIFLILAKFTSFRVVVQWATFRIPGIGTLLRSATIARFGVILGGLLKAGVPVVDAMQSLVQVTSIVSYKKFYEKMRDHILIGDSFAKTFAAIKHSDTLLPTSVQQLVITGEKSGALADITLKIADIYDKKATETAEKLPVILEPILLLIIGSLVGTIAIGIIVPIYSIVGSVGK